MSALGRLDKILALVEDSLAGAALAGAALLAGTAVILRYTSGYVIFWAEEATVYLVIFSTFVGAVATLRHNEHVDVDVLSFFFGNRGKRVLDFVAMLLIAVYCAIIGGYGWLLVTEPAARNTVTPALELPLWVVELSLPIGLTLMFIRCLQVLYRIGRGRIAFPDAEEEEYGERSGL